MGDTTIRVSEELADELYNRKDRTTSYEEYIWHLLEQLDNDQDNDETSENPFTRLTE